MATYGLSRYSFMPLSAIDRYTAEMRRRGVSAVARSNRGFLTAYRRAGGDPRRLSEAWLAKREAFIKRHMAQVTKRRESLGGALGPSRRHLALIAWAYSPQGRRMSSGGRRRSRGRR
jgi:hypothetical protein